MNSIEKSVYVERVFKFLILKAIRLHVKCFANHFVLFKTDALKITRKLLDCIVLLFVRYKDMKNCLYKLLLLYNVNKRNNIKDSGRILLNLSNLRNSENGRLPKTESPSSKECEI